MTLGRWQQPDHPARSAAPPWLPRVTAALLVGAPAIGSAVGAGLPTPVTVASVAAGLFLFLRQARGASGQWEGFVAPPGYTYQARDPEFGSTLSGSLSFPAHDFENVLIGHCGHRRWTYFEATQGVLKRERRLIIDLGRELPSVRAVRPAITGSRDQSWQAVREASMPGLIVGKTGEYVFPGGSNPDPHFLTSVITPAMTRVLVVADLPAWEIKGRYLVGHPSTFPGRAWAIGTLQAAADQLAEIASEIDAATGWTPPEQQTGWPTLPDA